MANSTVAIKRSRWPKVLLWILGSVLLLLLVLWFVATSSAFFKGVILPRVGKSMNATITVSDASISPLRRVILKDLKVTPNGRETLLTASEVRVRYGLFQILSGTTKIDELAIVSPVVEVVKRPDGTSNLDPILQSRDKEPAKPDAKSDPAKVDLDKFALNNATVRTITIHPGGARDVVELSNLNVTLEDLRNGQTATLALGGDVKIANAAQPGTLQGKLDGKFTAGFSPELKPATVQGNARFDVQNTSGQLAELAGLSADLNTDVTPTEIKQVALQFKKGNTALGQVRAQGPLDLGKMEGQVSVLILNIDRQVLNLAGAATGMDFGSTVINSTNQIQFANAGKSVTAVGDLGIARLTVKRAEQQPTPPLDLQVNYNVAVNNAEKSADLRLLTINGVQQQRNVLKGELTSPMRIAWGGAGAGAGDSTFRLTVDSLNLADWKALLGDMAGKVNMALNITSQQAGKQIGLDVTSQIDGFAMPLGESKLQNVTVSLRARGQAVNLNKITLPEFKFEAAHGGQPMATLAGNVQMDRTARSTDAQVTLDGALPAILKALARRDAGASSGAINGQLRVTQKGEAQNVNGKLALVSFNGQYGEQKFNNFGFAADLDAQREGAVMELRKAAGTLTGAGQPGGSFDVSGKYNSEKQSGQFAIKLANINQNGLRPFLEPMFKGKQLVSISINGDASASYAPDAPSAIKADFKVANLEVRDPKKSNPQNPLAAQFKLDAAQRQQVVELKQCELTLTPTSRAKNAIQITGRLDRSNADAMQGNLKVSAEALDLTPYYNLVSGDALPEEPAPAPATETPPPAPVNQEPEATKLPFRNTVADIQINRLYLRDIDVANFRSTVKLDGAAVLLKPLEMTLNGRPVSASVDLNLGVPGYRYDIAFKADRVPVGPIADSLSPDYRGRVKGDLLANVQLKGAGTTGVNLKKTLVGDIGLTVTNGNIQLVGPRSQTFLGKLGGVLTSVGIVIGLPDLSQSPVEWLDTSVKIGDGKIQLARLTVFSDAFIAESQGVIPIADVLTNSPINNLPVEISLSRSVAQRARLLPSNTDTNTPYVKLPRFVTVAGTVGDPKTRTDKAVIAGLIARSAAGLSGVIGKDASSVLQGVGGLLTGERGATGGTGSNTNAPPPDKKPRSLLDLIPKQQKK